MPLPLIFFAIIFFIAAFATFAIIYARHFSIDCRHAASFRYAACLPHAALPPAASAAARHFRCRYAIRHAAILLLTLIRRHAIAGFADAAISLRCQIEPLHATYTGQPLHADAAVSLATFRCH